MSKYQDLHIHLSGATSPVVLWEIIQESGFKTGAKSYWEFKDTIHMDRSKVTDLDGYLKVIHIIDQAQSSPLAIKRSVYNAYTSAYLSNCEYMELRWNPVKRSQDGIIDLDKLIVSARAGYEKAKSAFGIRGSMLLCLGRDMNEAQNEAIFKKVLQYHNKGIMGIDLAGAEKLSIPEPVELYYKVANTIGLVTTIHAGEEFTDKTESELEYILTKVRPQRIGHGVQIYRYPALLKLASKSGTLFEVCISSNLITRAVESKSKFKEIFKTFEDYNIKYCINTDATHALDTDIARENKLYKEIMKG